MNTKLAFLALGFLLLSLCASAQPEPIKWGKIDPEDLKMTVYAADSSAAAVVLGDYGEAYFTYSNDKGFQLNIKRHVRIKILKPEGLDWANVEVGLYHSGLNEEKILSTRGTTFNLVDGKEEKEKLSKSGIFQESLNEHVNLHKFTLPAVKVGSVIEFEYHKISDFVYSFDTWLFQTTIPTRWSELRARIPEYFGYKNFMSGYHPIHLNETDSYQDRFEVKGQSLQQQGGRIEKYHFTVTPQGTKHRWVMTDVPALKNEAYVTKLTDYASKIDFELNYTKYPNSTIKYYSSDWERLNKSFLEASRFGGELKKQRQVSELVSGITRGMLKPEEKIAAVYTWVQQNIKYNGLERTLMANSFKEVLAKKEGSSAEINLLLTAMLREAGAVADPVILSTRKNGRINPFVPLEKDFNYVVSQITVGERKLLLDATDPLLPLGMLPYRCMNDQGRLISEGYTTWVPLLNNEKDARSITGKLQLSAEGKLSGTLSFIRDGYEAQRIRRKLLQDGEEKYLESLAGGKGDWLLREHKIQNLKEISEKLEEHYTLEINNKATPAGDRMYVSLLPEGIEEENPFKMDERQYPVNFGCPTEQMFMYEIEIPAGYVVEELPKMAIVSLPDKSAIFRYSVSQMGNKLNVMSAMQIKKPVYGAEEYQHLKQFYQLMLAKQNEQVVLKKQTN